MVNELDKTSSFQGFGKTFEKDFIDGFVYLEYFRQKNLSDKKIPLLNSLPKEA